jgi:hypothetical protein
VQSNPLMHRPCIGSWRTFEGGISMCISPTGIGIRLASAVALALAATTPACGSSESSDEVTGEPAEQGLAERQHAPSVSSQAEAPDGSADGGKRGDGGGDGATRALPSWCNAISSDRKCAWAH